MVCQAVEQLRRIFNANKQSILEKANVKKAGTCVVVDFDMDNNTVAITDKMGHGEYKKFMVDIPNDIDEFGFYMYVYCHDGLSKARLERCFVEHLHEYLESDIGCFIPDGSTDYYCMKYMDYTTAEINEMCRGFQGVGNDANNGIRNQ